MPDNNQIGAAKMREIADKIRKEIPGLGFTLFVFELQRPGIANYISNAERKSMLMGLKECYFRLSKGQDIDTPEEN